MLKVRISQSNIALRIIKTSGCRHLQANWCCRQVTVIAATNTAAAVAAKAATTSIPIVFSIAGNPIQLGLVASLNRPDGNVTGVTLLALEVTPKRLELLHQLLPVATTMALLINPSNPVLAEPQISDLQAAAPSLGLVSSDVRI
ncbi:ABC transporter substrate binding protein [Bradyrhizobium sp. USDA 4486]